MNWLRRQLMRPPATATPRAVAGPSSRSGTVFIACTPETFTYDADGNMTSDGRFHYFWNGENRLVCASNAEVIVTYAYDHRGRMVTKTLWASASSAPLRDENTLLTSRILREIKSTTYIWDDWNIIREVVREGDSVAVSDNVWGLDLDGTLQGAGGVGGLLAVIRSNSNSNSSLYFPTFDANGNISEYVSESGEIVAHYDYSPFGEPLVASGPLAATFTHQFSTKPYCPVTGFSEYQMRKYNPGIGRWMSRDLITTISGFSPNPEILLNNQAQNSIDFLGKMDFDEFVKSMRILFKALENAKSCILGMAAAEKKARKWFDTIKADYTCCVNNTSVPIESFPGIVSGDPFSTYGVLHCALGAAASKEGVDFDCLNVFNALWETWEIIDPYRFEWMPIRPSWWPSDFPWWNSKGFEGWVQDTISDMQAIISGYRSTNMDECIPKECEKDHYDVK